MKRRSIPVRGPRAAASALGVGLVALLCVLVVSACGSSSASSTSTSASTSTGTTTTSGTTTTGGSFAAYSACLQQHGVTFGQGGGFGGGGFGGGAGGSSGGSPPTQTPAQQKAFAACASLRPTGGFGGGGFRGGGAANNPAFAKFQACLKQHGVQTGSSVDRTSPAYQAAMTACRSLLPAGGFGGFGAGGGGANSSNPAFAKFQACLKQHGVVTGAAGQTPAKTQAAIAACRTLLPNGGAGTPGTTTTTPGTTTSAAAG